MGSHFLPINHRQSGLRIILFILVVNMKIYLFWVYKVTFYLVLDTQTKEKRGKINYHIYREMEEFNCSLHPQFS